MEFSEVWILFIFLVTAIEVALRTERYKNIFRRCLLSAVYVYVTEVSEASSGFVNI